MLIVFTMDGCPYCDELKSKLNKRHIEFIDRNIDEYSDEYLMFVELTKSYYVPGFMIIHEDENGDHSSEVFAPERDFFDIDEAIQIIIKKED